MADADQALGQNVDQESAQELICGDGHDLLLAAVRKVFPAKRDSIILERNQSMVGDGDAVRIASEIVQNMLGTAEGWLGIDDQFSRKSCRGNFRMQRGSTRLWSEP